MGGRRECVSGSLSRAQSEVYGVGTSGGASDNVEPVRIDVYGPLDRPLVVHAGSWRRTGGERGGYGRLVQNFWLFFEAES